MAIQKKTKNYYVSTCPDTGRQFIVQEGKDNNIVELTPAVVRDMKVRYLHGFKPKKKKS